MGNRTAFRELHPDSCSLVIRAVEILQRDRLPPLLLISSMPSSPLALFVAYHGIGQRRSLRGRGTST